MALQKSLTGFTEYVNLFVKLVNPWRCYMKLSKEKMAEYQKARRAKLKGCPLEICPSPESIHECAGCVEKGLEIKKLLAKVSLLELQVKKGIKSEPLPTGDDAGDLFTRNIAAKNARFQKIGLMAHQND
jgi:hypothetical protein